jgi:hypothetical protein
MTLTCTVFSGIYLFFQIHVLNVNVFPIFIKICIFHYNSRKIKRDMCYIFILFYVKYVRVKHNLILMDCLIKYVFYTFIYYYYYIFSRI